MCYPLTSRRTPINAPGESGCVATRYGDIGMRGRNDAAVIDGRPRKKRKESCSNRVFEGPSGGVVDLTYLLS